MKGTEAGPLAVTHSERTVSVCSHLSSFVLFPHSRLNYSCLGFQIFKLQLLKERLFIMPCVTLCCFSRP